jgi:hypothetical protein
VPRSPKPVCEALRRRAHARARARRSIWHYGSDQSELGRTRTSLQIAPTSLGGLDGGLNGRGKGRTRRSLRFSSLRSLKRFSGRLRFNAESRLRGAHAQDGPPGHAALGSRDARAPAPHHRTPAPAPPELEDRRRSTTRDRSSVHPHARRRGSVRAARLVCVRTPPMSCSEARGAFGVQLPSRRRRTFEAWRRVRT